MLWCASHRSPRRARSAPPKSTPTPLPPWVRPPNSTVWPPFATIYPSSAPKGLVERLPRSRRYPLRATGHSICLIFLKLFEKVYAPCAAARLQPVPGGAALAPRDARCSIASIRASTPRSTGFCTRRILANMAAEPANCEPLGERGPIVRVEKRHQIPIGSWPSRAVETEVSGEREKSSCPATR